MTIQTILESLDKVTTAGQSKWRAACPVHGGKHRNLMVSERSDGSVGVHCFVCGADGVALCNALGLPIAEIFSPDSKYERPVITKRMQEQLMEDELVISIAEADQERGKRLTLEDKKRVRLAEARIEGIRAKQQQMHN